MLSADGSGFNDSPGGHTLAFPVPEDTTRFSVHEKEQAGDHDRGDQREQPQHHPRSSSLEGNEVEGELRTPPYTPSSLAPSHVDTTTGTQECLRLLSEFATKLRENTSWDTDHNDDDQLVSSLTMLMTEEADYTKTMADLDLLEGFVTVWIRAAEICANKFPMPTIPARLVSPMSKGKAPARQTPSPEPRPHAPPTNDYFEHFPEATVNFPQPEEAASSSMLSAAIGESSSHMPPRAASPILPPLVEEDDGHDDPRVHRCYTEVIADPNDDMAINIKLMDRVRLEIEMDDRVTGIGTNLNTGAMGSFPLSCLVVPSDVDIRPHDGSPFNGNRNSIMSLAAATPIIEQTPPGRGFADAHTPQFTAHHIVASPLTESPKMPNALHASASFPPDNMSAGPSTTPGPVSPTSLHRPASLSSRVSIVSTSSANSASESQYSAAYDRMSMISAEFDDLHALPARGASIQRHNQNNPVPLPPRSSSTSAVPPPLPEPRTQRDSKASFSSYASSSGPVTPPVQLSRELSAQVLEKRKYARQVIEELFETERNFRDGMQVLIDQFMLPLGQACIASSTGDSSDQIITRMEHSVLFRNIPGLRNLSRKICGLLQAAMDRAESDQQNLTGGGAVGAVVDVFLIKVEFEEWSTYVRYMEGFAHSKTTYDNLKKREAFKAMLYRCESAKECNRQSFDHYIILPVQRISRYHLLLSRLKQVTDPEDPVHQSIETAEQYMKQIGDVLEAVQKQEEELRTVFSVFSEIKGCPVCVSMQRPPFR
ncbi:Dbl homology domain-containing protein [Powellomyces hirtus]|nr:Dbl homology domain-containing protein [Powellomyces hirtus]